MKGLLHNLNFLVCIAVLSSVHELNGMFECILTHLEVTDKDSPYGIFNNIKLVRFNRTTFVVNGSFELFVDTVDEYDGICNAYKKMGNEYKLLPYKIGPVNACEGLKKDELFYPFFYNSTENFPPLGSCDFKRGIIYKINNYLPNLDKVPPVFQSGDYMIECKILKDDQFIQGGKVYAQLYNIASAGTYKG